VACTVQLNIVPLDPDADLGALLRDVRRDVFVRAGGPFDLTVVPADDVPLTVGGKGKFVTSEYPIGT
jgi:phenylacetate-CoA ligase